MSEVLNRISSSLESLNLEDRLVLIADLFPGQVVFSTSFSKEDQLITERIVKRNLDVEIFTLDTLKLFPETRELWKETERKYGLTIKGYKPEKEAVDNYVKQHGEEGYYKDISLRKECCYIRKIAPLKKALAGKEIWLSGVRASHSNARSNKSVVEYDTALELYKIYPLLEISDQELEEEIISKQIPVNKLYSKNFLSIGCAPCTRAVQPGEDARAGRWWWEQDEVQECGLHVKNGKLVRSKKG